MRHTRDPPTNNGSGDTLPATPEVDGRPTDGTRDVVTNAEKRSAVRAALGDPERSQWSDRELARQCGVSHWLVGRLRNDGGETQAAARTFVEAGPNN